ncbi:MAG: hypothetical protein CME70_04670 [Halobacteriovorax sp.]|nr:hypothetical protein [Halobacteriovorax sp.]|tara:strand:+ start:72282 stop:73427 length:1146 start_codon:yes stop_codon:yes gene_type:complete
MNSENRKWLQVIGSVTLVLTILFSYTHCVVQSPKKTARKSASSEDEQVSGNSGTNNTGNNTNNNNNNNNNNTGGNTTAAEDFFEQTVKTTFENNCMFCHDLPQNNPPVQAPITIYEYQNMRQMMMVGTSGVQNNLMNKIQGITAHTGGNRCPSGVADPICDVVIQWYELENPGSNNNNNNTNTDPTGDILDITSLGKITGWAANPSNVGELVTVKFYLDGQQGGAGTFIGSTIAANPGFNGGYAGNHAFQFYVPLSYRDGTTHQLYAYASSNNQDYLINQTPITFAAYTTSSAGFNFYQANLRPILETQCSSCHAVNYDIHFNNLLEPTPAAGGTATNNQFVRMPAGSFNGLGHPGGNICGSVNGSPCNLIQQWWTIEFGN